MTWTLAVPKALLEPIYERFNVTIDWSIFEREPINDDDYIDNYLASKLWRMNNLYTFIDKHGQRGIFRMNLAQHIVYAASLYHPRLIILKSRQQGISTFWLICFLDDAITLPDLNIGLMAQGKAESATLLKRTKLAYDNLDPDFTGMLELDQVKDATEEQGYNTNSVVFIRTSFRSTTLQRLHVSEYGKICKASPDKAREVKTGTMQAIAPGNTLVIESTAEGQNDFKTMWETAVRDVERYVNTGGRLPGKSFYPIFLSWLDDPTCVSDVDEVPTAEQLKYFTELEEKTGRVVTKQQRNFWIQQFAELGEHIYQEYPATPEEAFTKVNSGAYYATLYTAKVINRGRRIKGLYDPLLPVYVSIDLGVDDLFVLVFFQYFDSTVRIVGEYFASGEGLEHYVKFMYDTGYEIHTVFCPHDIQVRELGNKAQTRLERLHELGVTNTVVLSKSSIADGIEAVRAMIPYLYIDLDCTYIDGCMLNYSKEWDEALETFKPSPRHDKWSHGSDAVRGVANSLYYITGETLDEIRFKNEDDGFVTDGMAM